jgi:ubiquitin C-terminal hydrolase
MDIRCSRCQYSQGQLYKFVEKTPNILIIHLNRFKRTKDDYVRFNNKINFPEDLSLSKITLNSDRANDSFQLYGLIGLRDNDVDRE